MLIELDYPVAVSVKLDAEKTLLLIIDMENENAHPDGPLYIGDPVRKIIPKIRDLREKVRPAGARVIYLNRCAHPKPLSLHFSKTRFENWKEAGGRT
jgi:nicotinamidase-related amidase